MWSSTGHPATYAQGIKRLVHISRSGFTKRVAFCDYVGIGT